MKNGWQEKTLRDVCTKITDGSHGSPKSVNSGLPMASVKDLTPHGINLESCRFITKEDFAKLVKYDCRPQKGDVLIAKDGATALDTVCQINEEIEVVLLSSVAILSPNTNVVTTSFLRYFMDSPITRKYLKGGYITGAAIPRIVLEDFKRALIRYPSISKQTKITFILSAYDDLTENNIRRIKILEEMARRIYHEWSVEFNAPGIKLRKATPEEKKVTGKDVFPEGWAVKRVEDLVKRIPSGKKYENKTAKEIGTVPIIDQGKSGVIGYHDDEPGVIASMDDPVIVFTNHTCYQRLIQFPFSAIQNVLPFVPTEVSFLNRNIYWLHWATNGIISFNDYKGHWPEFMKKMIVVPRKEDSERFGFNIKPMAQAIYSMEKQNTNLRQTRDLLLPKLISGEVEV
jgi:Restriction endonuclease S subunits